MNRKTALLIMLTAPATACGSEGSDVGGSLLDFPRTESTLSQPADPFAMEVGDCFDDTAMGTNEFSEIPEVPCSSPHDNEVYALFDLTSGAFPGDEQTEASAGRGCYERFAPAIGRAYLESVIDFIAMHPTEDSWNQINDREVVCFAYHMEYEKLTGSVLGSGR